MEVVCCHNAGEHVTESGEWEAGGLYRSFQELQKRNLASFSVEKEFSKNDWVRSQHRAKFKVECPHEAIASINQNVGEEDDPGRRVRNLNTFLGDG